ncbi:MAG: hypothetical protein ABSE73_14235 [Planctomycetota bacterium]
MQNPARNLHHGRGIVNRPVVLPGSQSLQESRREWQGFPLAVLVACPFRPRGQRPGLQVQVGPSEQPAFILPQASFQHDAIRQRDIAAFIGKPGLLCQRDRGRLEGPVFPWPVLVRAQGAPAGAFQGRGKQRGKLGLAKGAAYAALFVLIPL